VTIRPDARRHPRFRLFEDIRVTSPSCGVRLGHTVDISRSGISALLDSDLPLGEFVELRFALPSGEVTTHATVRQHLGFRYGFEFSAAHRTQEMIEESCQALAIKEAARRGLSPS
jgi:hypothetical protein